MTFESFTYASDGLETQSDFNMIVVPDNPFYLTKSYGGPSGMPEEGGEITVTARSFKSSKFTVDGFYYNGVVYQNFFLHDILEMIATGHSPGTPENPVDDLDEVLVIADSDSMTASEAFQWVADIMHTIGGGFELASYSFGVGTVGAVVTPVPGDEVLLGALTVSAGGSALLANKFGDWAEQQASYYERGGGGSGPHVEPRPYNRTNLLAVA